MNRCLKWRISAWRFLIHLFFYMGVCCITKCISWHSYQYNSLLCSHIIILRRSIVWYQSSSYKLQATFIVQDEQRMDNFLNEKAFSDGHILAGLMWFWTLSIDLFLYYFHPKWSCASGYNTTCSLKKCSVHYQSHGLKTTLIKKKWLPMNTNCPALTIHFATLQFSWFAAFYNYYWLIL